MGESITKVIVDSVGMGLSFVELLIIAPLGLLAAWALWSSVRRRRLERIQHELIAAESAKGIRVEGPQVAGRPCAECKGKITTHMDGTWCAPCDAAVHLDCNGAHQRAKHQAASSAPYR